MGIAVDIDISRWLRQVIKEAAVFADAAAFFCLRARRYGGSWAIIYVDFYLPTLPPENRRPQRR